MIRRFAMLAIAALIVGAGCSGGSEPETTNETPKPEAPKTESAESKVEGAMAVGAKFSDVQAILKSSCVACHGGPAPKEKLDLSSYENLMKGSEHGPVLVPGDPAKSLIVKAVKGQGMKQMPALGDPLSADQIAKIEAWIKAGARKD